jgi:hypothetical protein
MQAGGEYADLAAWVAAKRGIHLGAASKVEHLPPPAPPPRRPGAAWTASGKNLKKPPALTERQGPRK